MIIKLLLGIIGLVGFLVLLAFLASKRYTTAYIAGAAGLTLCNLIGFKPEDTVIFVIICYLIVFFIAEDLDPEQIVIRDAEDTIPDFSFRAEITLARIAFFTICFLFPLPKPFGYVPGFITAIIAIFLLIASYEPDKVQVDFAAFCRDGSLVEKSNPRDVESSISNFLGGVFIFFLLCLILSFFEGGLSIYPILAGIVLSNKFGSWKNERTLAERYEVFPIVNTIILFVVTLFCPGLSVNIGATWFIAPGAFRIMVASFTSAAIEGWALGSIIHGSAVTSKGVLSNLLLSPISPNHTSLLDGSGLGVEAVIKIFLVCIVPVTFIVWMARVEEANHLDSELRAGAPNFIVPVLYVAQAIMSSSLLSCIILLPTSLIIASLLNSDNSSVRSFKGILLLIPMTLP